VKTQANFMIVGLLMEFLLKIQAVSSSVLIFI